MPPKNKVITYENLEQQVRDTLASNNLDGLRAQLAKQHPANIAAVLDRLTHPQRHQGRSSLPW